MLHHLYRYSHGLGWKTLTVCPLPGAVSPENGGIEGALVASGYEIERHRRWGDPGAFEVHAYEADESSQPPDGFVVVVRQSITLRSYLVFCEGFPDYVELMNKCLLSMVAKDRGAAARLPIAAPAKSEAPSGPQCVPTREKPAGDRVVEFTTEHSRSGD